jgi:hypothetical protein
LFVYYGKNKAVLINFPSDNDFFDIGVFNNWDQEWKFRKDQ